MLNKVIAGIMLGVLLVLHHDFWNWDNTALIFGYMPVGLAYHAAISIAAAGIGAWCCFLCWPKELSEESEETQA